MKDSQRSKVYKAEFAVRRFIDNPGYGNAVDGPFDQRWETIADVQRFADGVCHTEGRLPVPFYATPDPDAKVSYFQPADREIHLARWALRATVVLHELAHAFTDRILPSHGGEWAEQFLHLLTEHSGAEHAQYLSTAYQRCGVTVGRRPAAALKSARAIAAKQYCNGVGTPTDPWVRAVYLDSDGVSLIDQVARLVAADRTGVTLRARGAEVTHNVRTADLCYVRRS